MTFTIDTKVLEGHDLSLGDFLLLLMGYHGIQYEKHYHNLVDSGLAVENFNDRMLVTLSDKAWKKVDDILAESRGGIRKPGNELRDIAIKMQALYPEGNKPGTSYSWRGNLNEIVGKLHTLVAKYHFIFSEQEAVLAVKQYLYEFRDGDVRCMSLLKYFILKTTRDKTGYTDISSPFMSYIETIRDNKELEK